MSIMDCMCVPINIRIFIVLLLSTLLFGCETSKSKDLIIEPQLNRIEVQSLFNEGFNFDPLDIVDDTLYYTYTLKGNPSLEMDTVIQSKDLLGNEKEVMTIDSEYYLSSFTVSKGYYYYVTIPKVAQFDDNYIHYYIQRVSIEDVTQHELIFSGKSNFILSVPVLNVLDDTVYALVEDFISDTSGGIIKENYLLNVSTHQKVIEVASEIIENEDFDQSTYWNWSSGPVLDADNSEIIFSVVRKSNLDDTLTSKLYVYDGSETSVEYFEDYIMRYFIQVNDKIVFTTTELNSSPNLVFTDLNQTINMSESLQPVQSIAKIDDYEDGAIIELDINGVLTLNYVTIDSENNLNLSLIKTLKTPSEYISILASKTILITDDLTDNPIIVEYIK